MTSRWLRTPSAASSPLARAASRSADSSAPANKHERRQRRVRQGRHRGDVLLAPLVKPGERPETARARGMLIHVARPCAREGQQPQRVTGRRGSKMT